MAECEKKTGKEVKTLKELRKKAGMKQSELAERAGVSKFSVSAWERGLQKPNWSHLSILAGLLNTSVVNLIDILGIGEITVDNGTIEKDAAETDPPELSIYHQERKLTAREQIGAVSEILYLFTLLDEQGKKTVRTAFEISEKGADGHDHAEGA